MKTEYTLEEAKRYLRGGGLCPAHVDNIEDSFGDDQKTITRRELDDFIDYYQE